jgi:SAM-dependent methyltransferase
MSLLPDDARKRVPLPARRAAHRLRRWATRVALERRYDVPTEFSRQPDVSTVPSPHGILGRILRPADVSADDVFIDLGCGVGHMLLYAADHFPFRRVIGVEIVPGLVKIAKETLERNRDRLRCRDWELVAEDALHYAVPDDVTVAYLYDPFRGEHFDTLISNLIASYDRNPRRFRIIYYAPREHRRLMGTERVRLVGFGRRMVRRWKAAEYLPMYEIVPAAHAAEGAIVLA